MASSKRTILIALVSWLIGIFLIANFAVLTLPKEVNSEYTGDSEFTGVAKSITPFVRFDGLHYLSIAQHGYTQPAYKAFFPLFPVAIGTLTHLTPHKSVAATAVTATILNIALLCVALLLMYRLFELDLKPAGATSAVLLVIAAPFAFVYAAPYTESLLLLSSVGAILAARKQRWLIAGLCAAAASATRLPGLILFPTLVIMYGESIDWKWRNVSLAAGNILLAPLGFIAYFGYLAVHGGIGTYAAAYHLAWPERHATLNIIGTVINPLVRFIGHGGLSMNTLIAWGSLAAATALLAVTWQKLSWGYRFFIVSNMALPLLSGSLDSLGRYYGVIFPLALSVVWACERFKIKIEAIYLLPVMMQGLLIALFVNGYFIG